MIPDYRLSRSELMNVYTSPHWLWSSSILFQPVVQACKEYVDEDAGTCKECYEKVNETEEEQIDDLRSAHNQHIFVWIE